jgi:hypothetical protein
MSTSPPVRLRLAVAAFASLAGLPLAAQQINTGTPPPNASWPVFSFGRPLSGTQYSSLGQSFTVPAATPVLDAFTFWVNQVDDIQNLPFYAYVFPFTPTGATTGTISGNYVFRSAQQTVSAAGPFPLALSFNTGALGLAPGGTYLALLSAAEFPNAPVGTFGGIFESTGGTTSTYPGGTALARISLASEGLAGLTAGPWAGAGGTTADLAFTATFNAAPVATVPEPEVTLMLATGLLGLAVVRRRRRPARSAGR